MVNSGSYDTSGAEGESVKAEFTQLEDDAVPRHFVTACASEASFTAVVPDTDIDLADVKYTEQETAPPDTEQDLNGAITSLADLSITAAATRTTLQCSLPLDRVRNVLELCRKTECHDPKFGNLYILEKYLKQNGKCNEPAGSDAEPTDAAVDSTPKPAMKRLLCLFCDRTFTSNNLKQKHVDRCHSVGQTRRSSSRTPSHNQSATACCFCNKLNHTNHTLNQLLEHLVNEHSNRYFACLSCQERFTAAHSLTDHHRIVHGIPDLEKTAAHDTENDQQAIHSEVIASTHSAQLNSSPPNVSVSETQSETNGIPADLEETIRASDIANENDSNDSETPEAQAEEILPKKKPKNAIANAKTKSNGKKNAGINKKISVKSTKNGVRNNLRTTRASVKQLNNFNKNRKNKLVKSEGDDEKQTVAKKSTVSSSSVFSLVNAYTYKYEKIYDHASDSIKDANSVQFNAIFDREFYSRTVCNIRENLLNHLDGKLNRSVESESRISNFEHNPTSVLETDVKTVNNTLDNFGCNLSLNAVTPVATLLGSSQYGEDFDSQIEYGAKASQKKPKKVTVVKYKFTNKKYNSLFYEKDTHSDLTCLDMWTQLTVKKRQHKCHYDEDDFESYSLFGVHIPGTAAKHQVEELNRILDKRGPFEDLRLEANAAHLLELRKKSNMSEESLKDVDCILEEILNKVACECSDNQGVSDDKSTSVQKDTTEIINRVLAEVAPPGNNSETVELKMNQNLDVPNYLQLQRNSAKSSDIDKTDMITMICSSQEEGSENTKMELSGEWARPRIYICATCGLKLPNLKALEDHKNVTHPHIWCSHYEFVGKQSEIYKHLSIPGLGKVGVMELLPTSKAWQKSDARVCSKCTKQCQHLGELHKHMLECGGDWTWMLARKKCKYRPYGARTRRRRQRGYKRSCNPELSSTAREHKPKIKSAFIGPRPKPSKPSDAETIERMLANLPPKRNRKVISMRDGIQRPRKPYKQRIVSQTTCNKQPDSSVTNTNKKIKFKNNSAQISTKQNLRNTMKRKVSAQNFRNQNSRTETQPEIVDNSLKLRNRAPKNVTNETRNESDITQQIIGNKNKIRNKRMISRILGSKIFDSSSALVTRRRLVKAITQNNLIRKTRLRSKNVDLNTLTPDPSSDGVINEEQVPVKTKNPQDKKNKNGIKNQCSADESDIKIFEATSVKESVVIAHKNGKKTNGKRLLSVMTKSNKKTKNLPETHSVPLEKKTDTISAVIDEVVKMAYKEDRNLALAKPKEEEKQTKKAKKSSPVKKVTATNKTQEDINTSSDITTVSSDAKSSESVEESGTPVPELATSDKEYNTGACTQKSQKVLNKKTNKFLRNIKSIRKSMKKPKMIHDKTEGIASKLMRTLSIRGTNRKKRTKNINETNAESNVGAETTNTEIKNDINTNDLNAITNESDILKNNTNELPETLEKLDQMQTLSSDLETMPTLEKIAPISNNPPLQNQVPHIPVLSPAFSTNPVENNISNQSALVENNDTKPQIKTETAATDLKSGDKLLYNNTANNTLNKFKSKIKKPGRGLNDCIAMLKCKLEQKYQNSDTPSVDKSKLLILNSPNMHNNSVSNLHEQSKVQNDQITSNNITKNNTDEKLPASTDMKESSKSLNVLEIPTIKNQTNHLNKSTCSEMSTVETQTLNDITLETNTGYLTAEIPVNSQINFVLNAAMKNCLMECVKSKCEKLKIENQHININQHFKPSFKDRKIGSIRKRKRRINNVKSDKKINAKHIPNVPVLLNNAFIENSANKKDLGCTTISNKTVDDTSEDDIPLSKLVGSCTSRTALKIKLPVDKKKRRSKKKTDNAQLNADTLLDRVPQVTLEDKLEQHVSLDNSMNRKIEEIQTEVTAEKNKRRRKRDSCTETRNSNANILDNPLINHKKANTAQILKEHETRDEILSDISKYVNIIRQCEKLNFNTIVASSDYNTEQCAKHLYETENENTETARHENIINHSEKLTDEIIAAEHENSSSPVSVKHSENMNIDSNIEQSGNVNCASVVTVNEISTNILEEQTIRVNCEHVRENSDDLNTKTIENEQRNTQIENATERKAEIILETSNRSSEGMCEPVTIKLHEECNCQLINDENKTIIKQIEENINQVINWCNTIDVINLNKDHKAITIDYEEINNENDMDQYNNLSNEGESFITQTTELNDDSNYKQSKQLSCNTETESLEKVSAMITNEDMTNNIVQEQNQTVDENIRTEVSTDIHSHIHVLTEQCDSFDKDCNETDIDKLGNEPVKSIDYNEMIDEKEYKNKKIEGVISDTDGIKNIEFETNTKNSSLIPEDENTDTEVAQNEEINDIKEIIEMLNPLSQQLMSLEDEPCDTYMLNKTLTEANIEPSCNAGLKHNLIFSTLDNGESTKSNYVDNGKENSQEKSVYKKIKKHKKSVKKLKNKRRAKTKLKIVLPTSENCDQISKSSSKLNECSNYENTLELIIGNNHSGKQSVEPVNTKYEVQLNIEPEPEAHVMENKDILDSNNQPEFNELSQNKDDVQNISSSDSEDEMPLASLIKKSQQNSITDFKDSSNILTRTENLHSEIKEICSMNEQITLDKEIEELYGMNGDKDLCKRNVELYDANDQEILNISEEIMSININKNINEETDELADDFDADLVLENRSVCVNKELDAVIKIKNLLISTSPTENCVEETEDPIELLDNGKIITDLMTNAESEILVDKSAISVDNIIKSPNLNEKTCEEVYDFLKTPTSKPIVNESEFITTPDLNDGSLIIKIKKNFKVKLRKPKKSRKRVIPKSLNKNNVKRKEEEITSIVCDICNKTFKRKENLASHKRTLTHIAKLSEIEARENLAKRAAETEEKNEVIVTEPVQLENDESVNKSEEVMKEFENNEDIEIVEDNSIDVIVNLNEKLDVKLDDPVEQIISMETPKPIQNLLPGIIVHSSNSNLKLVDIINEVLDKPVNDLNIADTNYLHRNIISSPKNTEISENYAEPKRYKSLGERKSFDSDNFAIPQKCADVIPISDNYNSIPPVHNGLLSKQLSLLENIIEETSPNLNYIEDSMSLSSSQFDEPLVEQNMPEKDLFRASEYPTKLNDPQIKFSHSNDVISSYIKPNSFNHFENISDTFAKPINHYEEVSQPQFDEEDLKKKDNSTRKILNRDEELFLECCSLLKSGSEISGTTKKSTKHITLNNINEVNNSVWIEEKQAAPDRYIQRESYSWLAQGSRVNTPIGEPFVNNDWSNSNSAVSSEWLAQKAPSPDRPIENNTLAKKNDNICTQIRYADIQFEDISADDSIETNKTLMATDNQQKNIPLDFHNVDFSNENVSSHSESARGEDQVLEIEENNAAEFKENKLEEDEDIIEIIDDTSNIEEPKEEENITDEKEEINSRSDENISCNEFDAELKKKVVSAFGGLMAKALSNRLHAVVRKSKKSRMKREFVNSLQPSIADYTVPVKKNKLHDQLDSDMNDCRKKLITKGAMKIFEGIKVSIPTQDLNLKEVLNCNMKSKILNSEKIVHISPPTEEEMTDKIVEPNVKNGKIKKLFTRVGNKLGLRETKKKQNKHRSSQKHKNHIHKEKSHDIYDFEESLDNNFTFNNLSFPHFRSAKENMEKSENVFVQLNKKVDIIDTENKKKLQNDDHFSLSKWNIESDSDTDRYYDSMSFEEVSLSSDSTHESNTIMKDKPVQKKNTEKSKENQKKCMIMGRIFKNASKPKLEDKIPEIRDFSSEENSKLVENYLDSCSSIDNVDNKVQYENISPVPNNLTVINSANKMTKKEMDLLFDKLLEEEQKKFCHDKLKPITDEEIHEDIINETFADINNYEKHKKTEKAKLKVATKSKKRQRHNSANSTTSDEFLVRRKHANSSKKRHKSQRKSSKNKRDGGINLEQEIKECIGVAGRKSQRKCTSGKQNVLVEFWSSDETSLEEETAPGSTNNEGNIDEENNDSEEICRTEPLEDIMNTNSTSNSINFPESKLEMVEENIAKNLDVYEFDSDLEMDIMEPIGKQDLREYSSAHKTKLSKKNPRPKSSRSRKHSRTHDSEDTEYEGEKSRRKNEHRKKRNLESDTSQTNPDCLAVTRKKRNAGEMLYYWSSSSDDEFQDLIEVKPIREDTDDDRPMQHGWIVGDSPKKLVTMLAQAKGKKIDGESVKEQGKKNRITL